MRHSPVLAIMQPYFFPYLGYWQLIAASDIFVLNDDVQYIRHGWINRNQILRPDNGWTYMVVPLHRSACDTRIRDMRIDDSQPWRERIRGQLAAAYRKAPHFRLVMELVDTALDTRTSHIADLNAAIIGLVCHELGLSARLRVQSSGGFDYTNIREAGDWSLEVGHQIGARTYINPIGGAALYRADRFQACNMELNFLKMDERVYDQQRADFESSLSIIDVLMFTGIDGVKERLKACQIIQAQNMIS